MSDVDLLGDVPKKKLGIGYAGTPGTGPAGQTCWTCSYSQRRGGINRWYYKCMHERAYRSMSAASDIKLRTPACEHWANYTFTATEQESP